MPEAATHILGTAWSGAAPEQKAYCEVSGYVTPRVGFGMRLPSDWNGRFLYRGCGGFCGSVWVERCADAVQRGYACIASDMGHKSTPLDGKWAYNDRQAEIDFAYRATHVVAVAGKAIAEQYYGERHRFAYYQGLLRPAGARAWLRRNRFPRFRRHPSPAHR